MEIPEDAIEIVEEFIEFADLQRPVIDDLVTGFGTLTPDNVFGRRRFGAWLQTFEERLELFTFRWTKHDPFNLEFTGLRVDFGCYFTFSAERDFELYDPSNDEVFQIPRSLHKAFDVFEIIWHVRNELESGKVNNLGTWRILLEEALNTIIMNGQILLARLEIYIENANQKLISIEPEGEDSIDRGDGEQIAVVENSESNLAEENEDRIEPRLVDGGATLIYSKGTFEFTTEQSKVINIFWHNYQTGNRFMVEQDILEAAGLPNSTIRGLFRSSSNALKTILERHKRSKDRWRLNLN